MAGFCVSGFKIQAANPPAPPPPASPSTVVPGTKNSGTAGVAINFTPPTIQQNDIMIAVILIWNQLGGPPPSTLAGGVPAGWSTVREDFNNANGSLHGPVFTGIYKKVAGASEPASYTWTWSGATGNNGTQMMLAARGSNGLENVVANIIPNTVSGQGTAPSVLTPDAIELCFIIGAFGTGSGSSITSNSGLPSAISNAYSAQSITAFYQFSTGASAPAQTLTCSNINDAFNLYQISMLPH